MNQNSGLKTFAKDAWPETVSEGLCDYCLLPGCDRIHHEPKIGLDGECLLKPYQDITLAHAGISYRYKVGRYIGHGGEAQVYTCRPYLAEGVLDSDPGKLLAIRLSIRPEERRRADYALRSTAVLPDRLLVHFLKHERTGNVSIGSAHYPCSVVQLVEGLTLEQLLQELTAPLTLPEAESLLGNLLRAVKDFSAVFQMPHGDLNPGNVMIQSLPSRLEGATSCNRFDLIKIIDYIDCLTARTKESLKFCAGYAAPEQVRKNAEGAYDIRFETDLFQCASILFRALTGSCLHQPFDCRRAFETQAGDLRFYDDDEEARDKLWKSVSNRPGDWRRFVTTLEGLLSDNLEIRRRTFRSWMDHAATGPNGGESCHEVIREHGSRHGKSEVRDLMWRDHFTGLDFCPVEVHGRVSWLSREPLKGWMVKQYIEYSGADDTPAVVSWSDSRMFIEMVSEQDRGSYRLPEWPELRAFYDKWGWQDGEWTSTRSGRPRKEAAPCDRGMSGRCGFPFCFAFSSVVVEGGTGSRKRQGWVERQICNSLNRYTMRLCIDRRKENDGSREEKNER